MQPRISHLLYRIYGTVYNWPLIRPVHQRINESKLVVTLGGWVGFVYSSSRKSICPISAPPQTILKCNTVRGTAPQPPEPHRFKNGDCARPIARHNYVQ